MTREERCKQCSCYRVEGKVCPYVPNLPLRWQRPEAKCKHPDGDRWVLCDTPERLRISGRVQPEQPPWILERLELCRTCQDTCFHRSCERQAAIRRPQFICPRVTVVTKDNWPMPELKLQD